jgi:serine/threonine-protein kinase
MTEAVSRERWRRLEAIYHEALGVADGDRAAFLERACGGDARLRKDVEDLLAVSGDAERFLERDTRPQDGAAAIAHAPLVGQQVGPYLITSLLGAGGMGDVYRARDTRLDRDVAIKVLRDEYPDADRVARFEREARAAAALNHPNILAVFDVGTHHGAPFLVFELLEGATLREVLRSGPLSADRAATYATHVAAALAAAHDKGIVHRDIKPENIFVTSDDRIKVLDFGVAKLMEPRAARRDATLPGALIGTVGYMSPEQVRGQPVDHRTDVFSFGAVAYEMLSGRRAFERETPADTLVAILEQEPAPLEPSSDPRAERLAQLVKRCLQKSPDARFDSCRDVVRLVSEGAASAPPRAISRPQRVAAGVLAILLVAVLGLWLTGFVPRRTAPGSIGSIAVLPFANLTSGADDDSLADGMTGALITNLAQISALRVVSSTSVMRYKKTQKRSPDIGAELKVDALVEGSIERAGDRVRISARLIRASTDELLWADAYDRSIRDLLVLHDEVAQAVAREIRIALTPEERAGLARARTVDPDAYLLYVKGRFLWDRRTEESINRAIGYFTQAVGRDPSYAAALSGLADCYLSLGFSFDVGSLAPGEAIPKAKDAATKALALDDSLAEAHNSLAYAKLTYDWDWNGAEAAFKRSLRLNPGYAQAHHWYAHLLSSSRRFDEALAESRRALELDPLSPIMNVHLGWHYLFARDYERALDQLAKSIELDPNYGLAYWYRGLAYEQQSRFADAAREMQRAAALLPGNAVVAADLGHLHAVAGDRRAAELALQELERASARKYVSPFGMALIHTGLGDRDRAFASLQRALRERSDLLVYLVVDPRLDALREDSRFVDLVRRVGVPR